MAATLPRMAAGWLSGGAFMPGAPEKFPVNTITNCGILTGFTPSGGGTFVF
jgi:hypothetical protein